MEAAADVWDENAVIPGSVAPDTYPEFVCMFVENSWPLLADETPEGTLETTSPEEMPGKKPDEIPEETPAGGLRRLVARVLPGWLP